MVHEPTVVPALGLVLFVGFTSIMAWGPLGQVWNTGGLVYDDLKPLNVTGHVLTVTGSSPPGTNSDSAWTYEPEHHKPSRFRADPPSGSLPRCGNASAAKKTGVGVPPAAAGRLLHRLRRQRKRKSGRRGRRDDGGETDFAEHRSFVTGEAPCSV